MAAGATYEPIASTTLSSTQSNYTFTSISQTYTDLVLVCNFPSGGFNFSIQVGNGSIDSGSNYNVTRLWGVGSGSGSSNLYSNDVYFIGNITAGAGSNAIVSLNNYTNTSAYKTALNRFNDAGAIVFNTVGLWKNTAAINQVRVFASAGSLASGTTLSLYGIKAA